MIRSITMTATTLLAAAALALVGCANPRPNPAQPDPFPPPLDNPRVNVVSPGLERGIAVQQASVVPAGPGPMQVQVPVRSLTDGTYMLDYRFVFFDENGMAIQPAMNWRMVRMLPRQVIYMNANSISDAARDWRLEIKWAE